MVTSTGELVTYEGLNELSPEGEIEEKTGTVRDAMSL